MNENLSLQNCRWEIGYMVSVGLNPWDESNTLTPTGIIGSFNVVRKRSVGCNVSKKSTPVAVTESFIVFRCAFPRLPSSVPSVGDNDSNKSTPTPVIGSFNVVRNEFLEHQRHSQVILTDIFRVTSNKG
ncbi:hypothetical protein J6590_015549 [Homalodisca vitripennis]|nr:hypothetical protein J6590_015549 [Homalodisca vitripennis]